MVELPKCSRCASQVSLFGRPRGVAFVRLKTGTGFNIGARCLDCEVWLPSGIAGRVGTWVPHEHFTERAVNAMPWVDTGDREQPCSVCEKLAILESHHLAPRKRFGADEAERWPKVDVCRPCHDRWHEVMG
jgi:hypothetical protein